MNSNHDDRFAAILRQSHAASLERLSPRVQAQLAQRRAVALREGGARPRHSIRRAAVGLAALGVIALGLRFGTPTAERDRTAMVAMPPAAANATMLDEDPEFYAWLASTDAQLVAME